MAPRKADEATTGEAPKNPSVTGDIFFTGPEGFGEHIQISTDGVLEYITARAVAVDILKKAGATARWQDEKRTPASYAPASPMETAAEELFGVKQDLGTKNCPVDGTLMKSYPGGVSATKKDKDGKPKKFGPRFVCPKCQNTVWA